MKKIYSILAVMCLCIAVNAQEFSKVKITNNNEAGYKISALEGVIYTEDLIIPDSLANTDMTGPKKLPVLEIGKFESQSQITGVKIPRLIKNIDRGAFAGCDNLRRVYMYADYSKITIGDNAFKTDFTALYVPKDSVEYFTSGTTQFTEIFKGGIFPIEEGAVSLTATAETKNYNNVELVWFLKNGVKKYILLVKDEDGKSILKNNAGGPVEELEFDANGNPFSGSAGVPARQLETNSTIKVVVTSIGPLGNKKKYNYEIKGTDSEETEIYKKTGTFSLDTESESVKLSQENNETLTPTGIEETRTKTEKARKVVLNGVVYIKRNGQLLNMLGQEVIR